MSRDCSCHGGSDGLRTGPLVGVLERPRYSPGLILEDSDLTSAVEYTRELNRLLFRSLFGCGVICGMEVAVGGDCGLEVSVAPGLALDGCGDPLHLTGPAIIKLGRKEGVLPPPGKTGPPVRVKEFWVIACATEKQCAPRELACDGDDLEMLRQPTRTRLGVEVSVSFEPPECICGCLELRRKSAKQSKEDYQKATNEHVGKLIEHYVSDANPDGQETHHGCGDDPYGCHKRHYGDPDCPADCGCGTACSCGCCILLGWVHWHGGARGRWVVLHKGVRRFIRPCLINDPMPWATNNTEDDDNSDSDDGNANGGIN